MTRRWLFADQLGPQFTGRGNVERDDRFETSVSGVFVAGDAGRGQSLIVWAIAEGRAAAAHVDAFLMGETALPAPVPAVVATIVSDADAYAGEVAAALRQAGLAVELDLTNQKINAKVREHSLAHVPVLAVVGRKEAESRTVALRRLGGSAQEVLPLDEAVRLLALEATPPDLKA